jgi:hypothetical protein
MMTTNAANDTEMTAAAFCNGVVSITMVPMGASWVVSVFLCGRNGSADLDRGEIDVTGELSFADALRFFNAYRAVSYDRSFKARRRAMLSRFS